MGIVVRQSIYTSIISYIGIAVGYVNLLYLYPKFLDLEQVGLLRTIQDAAILIAPFAQLGIAHSITRFYPQFAHNKDKGHSFINLILLLSTLTFALFLIIFFSLEKNIMSFFAQKASAILNYTSLVLWLTFILMVTTIYEYYARALLKVAFASFMRDIGIRLLQALLVTFYFLHVITFEQLLIMSVIVYAISLGILILYLTITKNLSVSLHLSTFSGGRIREVLTFSLFTFVGTSSMIIIGKIDSLMVTGMMGLTSTAIYTTAFYMATVIEIPKRAITQTATTIIARAFEKKSMIEVEDIYKKVAINQLIAGALLLIGVWANLPNIFKIMPKGGLYEAGAYVVTIVGAAKLIDMAFGPNSEIITLSKYYKFNIVLIVLLAITTIGFNYYLIPKFGILGSALATILTLIISNVVRFMFVMMKLKLNPFTMKTVVVIVISLATSSINFILPRLENIYFDMFYRSAIITMAFASLILVFQCSDEVNRVFKKVIGTIR